MGVINGRGVLEITADLEPVRAAIPGVEAKLAEAEAQLQPAYARFLAQRELGDAAGLAYQEAQAGLRRGEADAQRFTYEGGAAPREVALTVERLRRELVAAKEGYTLARAEEHRAQRAYNAVNVAANEARQLLHRLRSRDNSLTQELAKAERRDAKVAVTQEAAKGWLDKVRAKVAPATA